MRLMLTVVDPSRDAVVDAMVDADAETTVGQLVPRLEELFGTPSDRAAGAAGVGGAAGTGQRGGEANGGARVLDLRGSTARRHGPGGNGARRGAARPVFVRSEPVDPAGRLADSALRAGVVVSLGDARGCPAEEPVGLVEIRVVGGPGAGDVHRLAIGSFALGSDPRATVSLADAALPATVARVEVAPSGSVTIRSETESVQLHGLDRPTDPAAGPVVVPTESGDAESTFVVEPGTAPALLELDRSPVDAPVDWRPGGLLTAGTVLLALAETEPPDASLSPNPEGVTLDFNRPPRLLPPARKTEFTLPTEPHKPQRQTFPLLMMALPMIGAIIIASIMARPIYLLFGLLSPLMYLGQYFTSRRQGKDTYREQMQTYRERKANVERDARKALWVERAARRRDLPDPAALLLFASGPRARLWERRPTDPDWLELRVGTADLPSEVEVDDAAKESHNRKTTWCAPDVPASVPLLTTGVVGVAGAGELARRLGASMLAQLATLHSPTDLRLLVLCPPDADLHWQWVRWLPHSHGGDDGSALVLVGTDEQSTLRRIAELSRLVEARRQALEDPRSAPRGLFDQQVVVLMDGARRLRLLPGVVALLREGPAVGVRFLCLDDDERQLPDEAGAVVTAHGPWLRLRRTSAETVDGLRPDLVSTAWCERLARSLAPVRDVSGDDDGASVPATSRLLTVLACDPPDAQRLATGWKTGGRTTRAVIGEGADGPFAVDLSRDGPHGLVAGTTGAGKSELLQTVIASLAIGNRPDEMTFVLVDYKGGAAFKDCNHLPHTVGMVTDLDGHLTGRALESLAAELRRREHQLAAAGAKDIEDYLEALQPLQPGAEPMPRLVIVIDEFAALVAELPDFVTGLVDIARRGRSLGVHLILATQRPAGVVSNDIKSNTNLRIALRVTDAQDSSDVIDAQDAAYIAQSTPGRAYARLGHSSLAAFQTARVGGRPPGATAGSIEVRAVGWRDCSAPVSIGGGRAADESGQPTDLATLVDALRESQRLTGIATPPSPWLPPLDDVVTLDDLEQPSPSDAAEGVAVEGVASDGAVPPLPLGLSDVPSGQRREVATYDLERAGHLGVVGSPRSGRSTALRALAGVVGRRVSPRDVHLYAVDCGNNALLPLVSLPHTGAVVSRDQVDRLSRLTARMQSEIGRRQQMLATQGFADVREQRRAVPAEERLPFLLVLLDRWEGFVAAFDSVDSGRLVDAWLQILQEGAGVGIKVVLSGDRSTLVGRISTLVDDRVVLRLSDPGDYAAIGMRAKDVPEQMPPGRGFRATGLRETQVALLEPDSDGAAQVAALHRIGREAAQRWESERAGVEVPAAQRPFRVDPLPATIDVRAASSLSAVPPTQDEVVVGVGGDDLALRCFDATEHGPGLLVAGPPRSGRSTTLLTMLGSMRRAGWEAVVVAPRRSPLRDLDGTPGVRVFTGDADKAAVQEAVAALSGRRALLVDDLELVGQDGGIADIVTDTVAAWRDTGNLVVGAGTLEDLNGMYRGPVVSLKRSRAGVLLNPQNYNDGDILGVRLPRSVTGGAGPVGRGVLVAGAAWELVQVATP